MFTALIDRMLGRPEPEEIFQMPEEKPAVPFIVKVTREPEMQKAVACPDCSGEAFYAGPEAGSSINVKCANPECGNKFCRSRGGRMLPIENSNSLYSNKAVHLSLL